MTFAENYVCHYAIYTTYTIVLYRYIYSCLVNRRKCSQVGHCTVRCNITALQECRLNKYRYFPRLMINNILGILIYRLVLNLIHLHDNIELYSFSAFAQREGAITYNICIGKAGQVNAFFLT